MFPFLATLFGDQLFDRLPHLWDLMIPFCFKDTTSSQEKDFQRCSSTEEVNKLIFNLQVLEVLAPSLHRSLLTPVMEWLPNLFQVLAHPYKAVRHMSARCIAVLAKLDKELVINYSYATLTKNYII